VVRFRRKYGARAWLSLMGSRLSGPEDLRQESNWSDGVYAIFPRLGVLIRINNLRKLGQAQIDRPCQRSEWILREMLATIRTA
jgi:hypothetical protein